jgi:hypothetical protein
VNGLNSGGEGTCRGGVPNPRSVACTPATPYNKLLSQITHSSIFVMGDPPAAAPIHSTASLLATPCLRLPVPCIAVYTLPRPAPRPRCDTVRHTRALGLSCAVLPRALLGPSRKTGASHVQPPGGGPGKRIQRYPSVSTQGVQNSRWGWLCSPAGHPPVVVVGGHQEMGPRSPQKPPVVKS